MKIVIFDCNGGKFTKVLREHWESQGHKVEFTLYWDPVMCQDADVIFFDWVDNSVQRASDPNDKFYSELKCDFPKGRAKIICRCHDIDMWCHNLRGVKPGFIDDLVFVADHTARIAKERGEDKADRVHIIKHGIENKFTFKEHVHNKKIAWVGRYDSNKNFYKALDILMELPRDYELHACGRRKLANWEEAYFDDRVERNGLKVFYYEDVPDMNAWLEDKEFSLLTSGKEAFSYSTAEAMSKGIKPIIHHFYGATEVYPEKYIFDSNSEAVKMILSKDYNSIEYMDFIKKKYPISKFFEEYDKLLK